MRKASFITLICLLTIYPPYELSRLIVAHNGGAQFVFELCIIWIFYLIAIIVLTKVVR